MATESTSTEPTTPTKQLKFPTALTVLAGVLILVWLASFAIPSGSYEIDPDSGGPIPGTYHRLPSCDEVAAQPQSTTPTQPGEPPPLSPDGSFSPGEAQPCVSKSLIDQFTTLWSAPPSGLYGIENDRGYVSGDETGVLYGAGMIFLFVLAIGAFITVTMKTGAVEAGIARLALRFRHSPSMLVVVLMAIFALGGTTYGMWEETLGFFALLVPLALALRYDRVVAISIIFLGAGTGVLASTVNPFATGVASDAAGISITDGIGLRIAMWIILVPLAMGYVLRYGARVRRDPSLSLAPETVSTPTEIADVPPLARREKIILTIFFLAFGVMIYGFVPWNDVWGTIFDASFPPPTFSNFYFAQATVLFLVCAVLIGLISGMGEEGTVNTIVAGAADFLGAGLVIVLARSTTVVMKNTYITDTILHWMEDAVSGTSSTVFAELAWLVNVPLAFLVPSSSGHAALVMPILAPLATFAGIEKELSVTAYQAASGFVNYITPTSAVVMGGLTLAKVSYDRYLKFIAPFMVLMFIAICIFMAIGVAVE